MTQPPTLQGKYGTKSGPGSSVGIPTGYGMDDPRIESWCGRDFPHLSRPGPPSLLCNGSLVFPGGKKRPGPDPSPRSSVVVKKK